MTYKYFRFTKLSVFLVLLSLFLVSYGSCPPQTGKGLIIYKKNQIKKIESISFDNKEYIDSCIFVQLETSAKSIIGEVTQLETFDGKYFIFDKQTKTVKVFGRTGKFLYHIGKEGRGAGEYIAINAFFINKKEKKVCIFDPMNRAVYEYTLEGVFLQRKKHDTPQYTHIIKIVYAGDYIYCYSQLGWINNTIFTVLSSKDYTTKGEFRPYPFKLNEQMGIAFMTHPLSLVDGEFHYVSLFSDTIFRYDENKEKPYLLIETGKPNITPTYFKNRNLTNNPIKAFWQIEQDNNYSSGFTELGETNRYLLACFKMNQSFSFYFLDKNKTEGFLVENGKIPNFGKPNLVDGNKMIRVWTPEDIDFYLKNIKEGTVTPAKPIASILKGYDPEYHNPILAVYYMQ